MIPFKHRRRQCGFTRADAMATVFGVLLLGVVVWAGMALAGEKRRVWVCSHHLALLGRAFAEYAHDHGDALPPAVVEDGTNTTSWDKEIAIYLEPELAKQNSEEKQKKMEMKIAFFYECPSDREPRGGAAPRSYSMPIYDINRAGWPPQVESTGGLGLYLDSKAIKKARGTDAVVSASARPAIKTSIVKAPSDTALLVERISILNALWATKFACITSPQEQFDAKTFAAKDFHGGKMNYLLLDGHVELLLPQQSAGLGGGIGGLWTIQAGD